MCPVPVQPPAEIVRGECAKRRRECDLTGTRGTLGGDRACRVRETQECDWVYTRRTRCGDRACRVRVRENICSACFVSPHATLSRFL